MVADHCMSSVCVYLKTIMTKFAQGHTKTQTGRG